MFNIVVLNNVKQNCLNSYFHFWRYWLGGAVGKERGLVERGPEQLPHHHRLDVNIARLLKVLGYIYIVRQERLLYRICCLPAYFHWSCGLTWLSSLLLLSNQTNLVSFPSSVMKLFLDRPPSHLSSNSKQKENWIRQMKVRNIISEGRRPTNLSPWGCYLYLKLYSPPPKYKNIQVFFYSLNN